MKLIVGLGNPGEKYAANRHNVGFMALEEIASRHRFQPWKKRFQGLTAEGQIGPEKCVLIKPSTYMNESGRAVGEASRFYKIAVADVIVIHDELDLSPGTIRVKTGGGNAGHNGLKSISTNLGNDYVRVRIGIGHPGDKAMVSNYVLQDFAKSDRSWLDPLLEGIARGISKLVEGGDAVFLSEAARGKPITVPAMPPVRSVETSASVKKMNGSSALPPIHNETLPKPQSTSFQTVPVQAGREGGGAAVSTAVMMPVPEVLENKGSAQSGPAQQPSEHREPANDRPQFVAKKAAMPDLQAAPSFSAREREPAENIQTPPARSETPYSQKAVESSAASDTLSGERPAAQVVSGVEQVSQRPSTSPATQDKTFGEKLKAWFGSRARGKRSS